MAVSWSYEKVMQLIELFRSKSLLWDVTNKEFKAVKKKNEAYEEIAQALNVSRRDVEAKIHTLRTQFTREKKRIATNTIDGASDTQKIWLYYEPMQFLLRANSCDTSDTVDKTEENSLCESDIANVYFDLEESSSRLTPKAEVDDLSEIDFDDSKAEETDEQENEKEIEQENDPFDGAYNIAQVRSVTDDRDARGKMAVSWTYDRVMHLIELFHSKPLLWDSTTADYRYKIKRIEASKEIAHALNVRRRDVEAKIHGLRTQFTKERKKIAARIKDGVPLNELTKWAYYEPLKFLAGAPSRSKTAADNKTVNRNVCVNDIQAEYTLEVRKKESSEASERVTPDAASTSSRKRKTEELSRNRRESEEPPRNRREVEERNRRETDDDECIDIDDRRSKKKKTNEKDLYDIYGAYVASELRSVRDDQAVTQAKYHINNILYQLKMGHYDKGKNPKGREST